MKQEYDKYTIDDLLVWKQLFKKQETNLKNKASQAYLKCLSLMEDVVNESQLPEFEKINKWFLTQTGWQIEVVKGLIPAEDFFELLSRKKFCSSTWLRNIQQLDYIVEPDMFHDIFGHIPLLSFPIFSEFAFEFGKLGKTHSNNINSITALQRLYWFTIEFGLIKEDGIKAYGAGIISSFNETNKAIQPNHQHSDFNIEQILNKKFQIDSIQKEYFVIDSYDELFNSIDLTDKVINKRNELVVQ
jgi:phenylalanine-4-hydroxylase